MWEQLPEDNKNEYKRMILAFASLTEVFAQKAENDEETGVNGPIINSKFQETVFQKAFHASAEDIGNTSYDAAIRLIISPTQEIKYLIGIKTFGINSGDQKVAQFKANHNEWSELINTIENNSKQAKNDKDAIDRLNKDLYKQLAVNIATLRNMRISSSQSNIKGFKIKDEDNNVQAVYHVLMPSAKGEEPQIFVGETSYDKINIENINILGCTGIKTPTNFKFTDGNHEYKFTPADSQLYMNFHNKEIVKENWHVIYLDNPYEIFSDIADKLESKTSNTQISKDIITPIKTAPTIEYSKCWLLTNKYNEVEPFSGFNLFYGVGSKMGQEQRKKVVTKLNDKYNSFNDERINEVIKNIDLFLNNPAPSYSEKIEKKDFRNTIINQIHEINNPEFSGDTIKLLFRNSKEVYIPIPDSKNFHNNNPRFFVNLDKDLFDQNTGSLIPDEDERTFDLVFEPSGEKVKAHITQDYGKGIATKDDQGILGNWILHDIFQLKQYEPLTTKRLEEIGLNGIRMYKIKNDNSVHIQFIWIDKDKLPNDFVNKW